MKLIIVVLTLLLTHTSTISNDQSQSIEDYLHVIDRDDTRERQAADELSKEMHLEYRALDFITEYNYTFHKLKRLELLAKWNYLINPTKINLVEKFLMKNRNRIFFRDMFRKLVKRFDYNSFLNDSLKRQFTIIKNIDELALPDNYYHYLMEIKKSLINNYNNVTFCGYVNNICGYKYKPNIKSIMMNSRNSSELQYYWTTWYNKIGMEIKPNFIQYTYMKNKVAELNGFPTAAEVWLQEYNENNDLRKQLNSVFHDIHHFYQLIHGYVRWRLQNIYGPYIVPDREPISMHLLGNLGTETWGDIAHLVTPFPHIQLIDVTAEMIKQVYTPLKMFQMADEFFQSLNMTKLPILFWNNSIIQSPRNVHGDFRCQPPSAWYLYEPDDVRVKQCTKITMNDFISTHRILSQVQSFLHIQHLPYAFKKSSNPGFIIGFSESIALTVSSVKYLQKIGLLKEDFVLREQIRIKYLFKMALDKIIFLPFAYSMDLYRYKLFRNKIKEDSWNCMFWYLRQKYSGIAPPFRRNETCFDASAENFISHDYQYMGYLFANIIQFQFFEAACKIAGQYKEGNDKFSLDKCDFSDSLEAGNAFRKMLSMGASKPWNDVFKSMTNETILSAKPLLEYFKPLQKWLAKKVEHFKIPIGWNAPYQKCDSQNDDWDFD